jgi:hypothetical protein
MKIATSQTRTGRQNGGIRSCLNGIILTILPLGAALAQYSIPWHTIDGGGGTRPVRYRQRRPARLTAGAWTNSPSGGTNTVTVPATLPTKFYRLFKP